MDLVYGDLQLRDVPELKWSGSQSHLDHIIETIKRVDNDEVEMVYGKLNGAIIVKGGIDYKKIEGTGFIWMVNVKDEFQSKGIGSQYFTELERRIKVRGLNRVTMAVEESNPRAKALYLRNGYSEKEKIIERWDEIDSQGNIVKIVAPCDLLEKEL